MKIAGIIILLFLLLVIGSQIYAYWVRARASETELEKLQGDLARARIEEEKLKADLLYYQNPANLEKELRARFNYRDPGEKLIILVPSTSTTSTVSTSTQ